MSGRELLWTPARASSRLVRGVPRLPAVLVPREDLMRRLDILAALTVLQTPGGHGATMLVAAWARQRTALGDRVVWVDPPTGDGADALTGLEAVIEGHGLRTILVLDRVGSLQEAQLADRLGDLLQAWSTLHIVACGNSVQVLLAAARRVGVDAVVISGRDLAIGIDEFPAYAAAWGHDLEAAQLATSTS